MTTPRYCTVDDVIETLAIGQDVDEDNLAANAAGLDEDRLAERIRQAADDVDSSLYPCYAVPFDPDQPPDMIRSLTIAIAAYFATVTFNDDDPLDESHPVRQRYQWARSRLSDMVKGNAGLPGVDRITRDSTGAVVDTGAGSGARAGAPRNPHPRLFGADQYREPSRVPWDQPWFTPGW